MTSVATAARADGATPVRCRQLLHIYRSANPSAPDVVALAGLDLDVAPGEIVGVAGPSGSGKSTLLAHVAGLVRPSAGMLEVYGVNMGAATARQVARLRRERLSIMFQNPDRNLLPYATARQNVRLAAKGRSGIDADDVLELVRMSAQKNRPVARMSGGEKQRVALAVALGRNCGLVLADEPTGYLGGAERDAVLQTILDSRDQLGTAFLVVTHDDNVVGSTDRSVEIRTGRVGLVSEQGREYALVNGDGTVQLPTSHRDAFPPGTRLEISGDEDTLVLRRRSTL